MQLAKRISLPKRLFLFGGLSGLLLLPAGCAKAPGGSSGATSPVSGPQLFITMTVRGTINPNYYYYVLFNINNTPGPGGPGGTSVTGPVPVVAPPYGNGFAAGAFTNYVQFHGQRGSRRYGLWLLCYQPRFADSRFISALRAVLVQSSASTNTISFQLPLAQTCPRLAPI